MANAFDKPVDPFATHAQEVGKLLRATQWKGQQGVSYPVDSGTNLRSYPPQPPEEQRTRQSPPFAESAKTGIYIEKQRLGRVDFPPGERNSGRQFRPVTRDTIADNHRREFTEPVAKKAKNREPGPQPPGPPRSSPDDEPSHGGPWGLMLPGGVVRTKWTIPTAALKHVFDSAVRRSPEGKYGGRTDIQIWGGHEMNTPLHNRPQIAAWLAVEDATISAAREKFLVDLIHYATPLLSMGQSLETLYVALHVMVVEDGAKAQKMHQDNAGDSVYWTLACPLNNPDPASGGTQFAHELYDPKSHKGNSKWETGGAIIGTHAPAGIFAVHAWKGGAYHFDAANRSGSPRTFFYISIRSDWVSAAFTDLAGLNHSDAPPQLL